MHNPAHPGEILKALCLEPLKLTITQTAQALGIARKTLSELINQKSGMSPEMAIRLSKAFNTTPEFWMNLQQQYDLWHAKQKLSQTDISKIANLSHIG